MKNLILTLLVIIIAASSNIYAKDKDSKKDILKNARRDSLINVLIKASRIEQQLDEMVKSFDKYNESSQIKLQDFSEISKLLKKSFIKDTMVNTLRQNFRKKYDDLYIIKVIDWLNSPLSQKLFSLESKKYDSLSTEELQYMLASVPKSGRTINMARDLLKVTGIVDVTTDVTMSYIKALMMGINPKLPQDKQISANDMNYRIYNISKNLKDLMQQVMEMAFYYKYKDLSYSEYQQYIDFYSSSYGSWYNWTLLEGFKKSFDDAGNKFTEDLLKSRFALKLSENSSN